VIAAQIAVGNRAVQRLLSLPNPRIAVPAPVQREGWSGKDVKSDSTNTAKKLVGKTWRIPVEGIAGVGNQRNDLDDAYKWEIDPVTEKADKSKPTNFVRERTRETAIGRAIVLMPDNLDLKQPVEILLHLHGFGIGYRQAKGGGPTRDEAVDLTESQLEASKLNMIAVLPQGGYHSGFDAFSGDPYLSAVFAKVAGLWQRDDASDKSIIKDGGFLDLKKELVDGMDLDWGGSYGDMMHFDMRNKGVGAKVHKAITTYSGQKEQESAKEFAKQKEAEEKAAEAAKGITAP
jgi:hypothetical protein